MYLLITSTLGSLHLVDITKFFPSANEYDNQWRSLVVSRFEAIYIRYILFFAGANAVECVIMSMFTKACILVLVSRDMIVTSWHPYWNAQQILWRPFRYRYRLCLYTELAEFTFPPMWMCINVVCNSGATFLPSICRVALVIVTNGDYHQWTHWSFFNVFCNVYQWLSIHWSYMEHTVSK